MAKKKVTKKKTPKKAKAKGVGREATQFKKGNTAGTGYGRPKMTAEQKAMALTTRTQFKNLLVQYSALSLKELRELAKSEELPVSDLSLINHLIRQTETGDNTKVDWTNNHIMGRPKEVSHINVKSESTSSIDLKKLTKKELVDLKKLSEKSK